VPARGHWLKALGHAGGALPAAWLEDGRTDRLTRTAFPRRPRIAPGDRLVYYATGWRCLFAVVEAVAEPDDAHPNPVDPARWPWSVAVEPLLVIPRLDDAPPVQAAGIPPRSMSQQSHIRLTPAHYRLAVEAIGSVAL
jgi:hypothetical protein